MQQQIPLEARVPRLHSTRYHMTAEKWLPWGRLALSLDKHFALCNEHSGYADELWSGSSCRKQPCLHVLLARPILIRFRHGGSDFDQTALRAAAAENIQTFSGALQVARRRRFELTNRAIWRQIRQ